jgi:crotonobetainyl-CoA:carnitine CoA-transferase CaiB-like acyl-CoA transferase
MKALNGIRLIDLTHMLSGPYAGMMLADLGADTIKVEPPGRGEGTRALLASDPKNSIDGMGAYFLTLNRNKKSVTLDLKSEQGLALFYELVAQSDVVLNNFSAGVVEKLKIDYAHLSRVNPRIITCSITGFGETGPGAQRPAFDMVAQAMGGGMSITGQPGNPPTRAGIPIGDLGGGVMAVIGILSALVARQTTGRGQHVDISMLDAQVSLLNYMATMVDLSGEVPDKLGNAHFVHVPYNTFPTRDGHIIVAVITDQFWKNLIEVTGLTELDTPENERQPGRWKNQTLINTRLSEVFCTGTQAEWVARLTEARVPCAPVNTLAQAMEDVQIVARNMIVAVEHPNGQRVRMPGNPIKLSETYEDSFSPPPLLGQHTECVLREVLGKSDAEIGALRAAGVI